MKQQFEIPLKFIGLNEYVALSKGSKGYVGGGAIRYKAQTQADIVKCIRAYRVKPVKRPVHLTFIWYEATRRRDKDNVAFAKKFILDRLQNRRVLPNDNNNYVVGFQDCFIYGKGQKVVVKIEEADEDI